jgi:hypothetical protein
VKLAKRVVLNVTYNCNLRCKWCCQCLDRIQVSDSEMSLEQIDEFVKYAETQSEPFGKIRVCGGEPFTHPQIHDILERLSTLPLGRHVKRRISVSTNGTFGKPRLPRKTRRRFSPPSQKQHHPFLVSPTDLGLENYCQIPCSRPKLCGTCLDKWGWSFCYCAPMMGRLLGIKVHFKSLSKVKVIPEICRHCSLAVRLKPHAWATLQKTANRPSRTWRKALKRWRVKQNA